MQEQDKKLLKEIAERAAVSFREISLLKTQVYNLPEPLRKPLWTVLLSAKVNTEELMVRAKALYNKEI